MVTLLFQGHFYLRDFIVDEHSYSTVGFLPDGNFMYDAKVFTQYENKSHLLIQVLTHVELKPIGIH